MPRLLGLLLVQSLLAGCLPRAWIDDLNARKVKSCVEVIGFVTPFMLVRTISSTGGLAIDQCFPLRVVPPSTMPVLVVPEEKTP